MVEILIFVMLFLGIGMAEKNLRAIRKQNDQIIHLLEKLNKWIQQNVCYVTKKALGFY